jgi:hypothetical protein
MCSKLGMVVHTYHPITWEVETRGSGVPGQKGTETILKAKPLGFLVWLKW